MVGIGWDTSVPNARFLDYFAPAATTWDDPEKLHPADRASHLLSREWTAQVRDSVLKGRPAEAQLFLRVMREEILPMIDRLYRTTTDRGLFGHSAAGWFATYAMLEAPDLFSRFGIASPAYAWDDFRIFQIEAEYAKTHTSLPKTVVMTVTNEGFGEWSDVYRFANILLWRRTSAGRRYTGLKISVRVVPGDHASVQDLWTVLDELYPLKY
jgi:predicted alpha/beta superfamily hydrolase